MKIEVIVKDDNDKVIGHYYTVTHPPFEPTVISITQFPSVTVTDDKSNTFFQVDSHE